VKSYRWTFLSPRSDIAKLLAEELGISELTARIMAGRGLRSAEEARRFLRPQLGDLHDPSAMADMDKAVEKIREAVRAKRRILVYGDYDVDGVTSVAILVRFFSLLPYPVEVYLPERAREGYGLTGVAVANILQRRPDLLIAVDNGITAREEIAELRRNGISVVVVDHHLISGPIPDADAVINPRRADDAYPEKELCAAALAFKLAWGLARSFSNSKKVGSQFREFLCRAVGLACLGTVADVVPLTGENRVIVSYGLRALKADPGCGIGALLDASRYRNGRLTVENVAFGLAPRLNAAGRMKGPGEALDLLLCDAPEKARELAVSLEKLNRERQKIEAAILEEARSRVAEEAGRTRRMPAAIVLGGEGWHSGVIGIVAARLCDEFRRPAVAVSFSDGIGRGSARSFGGFHVAEMFLECKDDVVKAGGHAFAGGLTLLRDRFDRFRQNFVAAAERRIAANPSILDPELHLDAAVELSDLNAKAVEEIESLAPFGEANPEPALAAFGLRIRSPLKFMRDGRSFSFYVKDGEEKTARRVVAFRMSGRAAELESAASSGPVDLAFRPAVSSFTGEVELHLLDFRPSAT
jgi:single-stranded-DNA-specific exonuclease